MDLHSFLGLSPEALTLRQRQQLQGHWVALRLYTPQNLALRKIEAIAKTVPDCARYLVSNQQNPAEFEYFLLP